MTGPGQRPNYPQYNNPSGEIRSSPSAHQDSSYNPYSLLDPPPMLSASNPPILPNQPTPNPYVIHPSPPPQQNRSGHSGYSGGDDYEDRRPQLPPKPYVIHPSPPPPPPQESHQSRQGNYILGRDDHKVPTSVDDSPPVYRL